MFYQKAWILPFLPSQAEVLLPRRFHQASYSENRTFHRHVAVFTGPRCARFKSQWFEEVCAVLREATDSGE